MSEPVYVLVLSGPYGPIVSVYRTEEGARVALLAYVDQWWDHVMKSADGRIPSSPANGEYRIALFFGKSTTESFSIVETVVEG